MIRVLLGVSDKDNAERLYRGLHTSGMNVEMTWDFKEVASCGAASTMYNVVVLDPGPIRGGELGVGVLKLIRNSQWQLPVILLTDPSDRFKRKVAWQHACDDVLNRYIDISELAEIIRLRIERKPADADPTVWLSDSEVKLTRTGLMLWRGMLNTTVTADVYRILAYLFSHAKQPVNIDQLVAEVLHERYKGDTKKIRKLLSQAESALRSLGLSPLRRLEAITIRPEDIELIPIKVMYKEDAKRVAIEMAAALVGESEPEFGNELDKLKTLPRESAIAIHGTVPIRKDVIQRMTAQQLAAQRMPLPDDELPN